MAFQLNLIQKLWGPSYAKLTRKETELRLRKILDEFEPDLKFICTLFKKRAAKTTKIFDFKRGMEFINGILDQVFGIKILGGGNHNKQIYGLEHNNDFGIFWDNLEIIKNKQKEEEKKQKERDLILMSDLLNNLIDI